MQKMQDVGYLWSQLRRYVDAVEAFITQSGARLPLTPEQKARLRLQPESELEMPVGYEELIEATETFPEVLRRSAFILILTLLESTLNELCENLQRWSMNPFSVYDLGGRGIQRAAQYIRVVTGIAPTALTFWAEIQVLKEVRNVLVHANGRVPGGQLEQWADRVAKLGPLVALVAVCDVSATPSSDYVIVIRSGLCERAIKTTDGFLRSLLKSIDAKGIELDGRRCNGAMEPSAS